MPRCEVACFPSITFDETSNGIPEDAVPQPLLWPATAHLVVYYYCYYYYCLYVIITTISLTIFPVIIITHILIMVMIIIITITLVLIIVMIIISLFRSKAFQGSTPPIVEGHQMEIYPPSTLSPGFD